MASLEAEVRIKLIEVSKEWAEKIANYKGSGSQHPADYPKEFDTVYKELTKTVSEAMSAE